MKRIKYVACFILFIVFLSGCERNSADTLNDTYETDDNEYNLLITNNSPLFLKSVVVTVDEGNEDHKHSLISGNLDLREVAKFTVENGERSFKIKLNPKDNYSVSKDFSEVFRVGEVAEYEIVIDQNEVSIQRMKNK